MMIEVSELVLGALTAYVGMAMGVWFVRSLDDHKDGPWLATLWPLALIRGVAKFVIKDIEVAKNKRIWKTLEYEVSGTNNGRALHIEGDRVIVYLTPDGVKSRCTKRFPEEALKPIAKSIRSPEIFMLDKEMDSKFLELDP